MDASTKSPADRAGALTATADRQAAERACDEALLRIEATVRRILADAGGDRGDDASLAEAVSEYASCAQAAGMRPEHMVKPLKVALGRFFYERREQADDLLRIALLRYFEITP